MNTAFIAIAIFVVGALANLVWMLVNLRIENKLLVKLDKLKDWMLGTFTPTLVADEKLDKALEVANERIATAKAVSDERFGSMNYRLNLLEGNNPRRVNGAALD